MTEAVLVRRIVAVLRARGAVVYRTHGSVFGQAGVGDLIVGWEGRYYELEVKLPGRPLSAIQQHRQAEVQRAGCEAAVVHSTAEALQIMAGAAMSQVPFYTVVIDDDGEAE